MNLNDWCGLRRIIWTFEGGFAEILRNRFWFCLGERERTSMKRDHWWRNATWCSGFHIRLVVWAGVAVKQKRLYWCQVSIWCDSICYKRRWETCREGWKSAHFLKFFAIILRELFWQLERILDNGLWNSDRAKRTAVKQEVLVEGPYASSRMRSRARKNRGWNCKKEEMVRVTEYSSQQSQ